MTVLDTRPICKASILSRLCRRKLMTIALPVLAALFMAVPVYAENDIHVKGHGTPVVVVKGKTVHT